MTQREMIWPEAVRPGDRVAIVAPAGPFETRWLEAGCAWLRSWGLKPVFDPEMTERWGYLAGHDQARRTRFVRAWEDPSLKAILCARGGYGTIRLLEALPWEIFRRHPKRFVGFSDITLLLLGLSQESGLIGLHGPMAASGLFAEGTHDSQERLKKALFSASLREAIPKLEGTSLQKGRGQGRLCGGNLSLLASSIGTPWQIQTQGTILFLEDINEPPYRVDRMLQQLRYSGLLDGLAGLALGDFGDLRDQYQSYTAEEFWLQRLGLPSTLPVIAGLPVGHIHNNATLPIGAEVILDADEGSLQVIE